jgi:hypothetical protein
MDSLTQNRKFNKVLLIIRKIFISSKMLLESAAARNLKSLMNLHTAIMILALGFASVGVARGQTLNWGNELGDGVTDSHGNPIDSMFVIEIGAFFDDFVPNDGNTEDWIANWQVFDRAVYNADLGYFTSEVYIQNDVTSSNPSASTLSFAGLSAFLWIRKGEDPVEGSEWLLARADDWTFPLIGGDCCNTEVVEWSVSDLSGGAVLPVWGRQTDQEGFGEYTTISGTGLQTFTFIPEPSSSMMGMIAVFGMVMRRRRNLT